MMQLHFGEPPRWSPTVKFILLDIEPSPHDRSRAAVTLVADGAVAVSQLTESLAASDPAPLQPAHYSQWVQVGVVRRGTGDGRFLLIGVDDRVEDRVEDCVDDRVEDCVDDRVGDFVDDRVEDCVEDRVKDRGTRDHVFG